MRWHFGKHSANDLAFQGVNAQQGDMETVIPVMVNKGERYDVINMDRILDMVLDAGKCIQMVKGLMTEKSILVIKVANNYSYLQQMLMRSGELKEEYWLDAHHRSHSLLYWQVNPPERD